MSFGFEVRDAKGVIQLDTTTWGWQFVTTIRRSSRAGDRLYDLRDDRSNGSIVFDGQGGRPLVPAGSELYAMNVLDMNQNAEMLWTSFTYQTEGLYRKLTWGKIQRIGSSERKNSYDPDHVYRTTIYVFAR